MVDDLDDEVDLIACLIKHPDSTCVLTVTGDSMEEDGIFHGDILIVDRAIEPNPRSIVIVMVDGEFTVKRISKVGGRFWLVPSNKKHPSREIMRSQQFRVWGVVQWILHKT
jgi:DNA polymerase V